MSGRGQRAEDRDLDGAPIEERGILAPMLPGDAALDDIGTLLRIWKDPRRLETALTTLMRARRHLDAALTESMARLETIRAERAELAAAQATAAETAALRERLVAAEAQMAALQQALGERLDTAGHPKGEPAGEPAAEA